MNTFARRVARLESLRASGQPSGRLGLVVPEVMSPEAWVAAAGRFYDENPPGMSWVSLWEQSK